VSGSAPQVEGDELLRVPARKLVDGPRKQFLARAAGTFHEHRAVALSHGRQQIKQLPHRRAAPDDVRKRILLLGFAAQFVHQSQVAEALDAADGFAARILERGGGNADRDAFTPRVHDVNDLVGHGPVGGQGLLQRAGGFADEARNTSQQRRPTASCRRMPVICSAARLKKVMRQSASTVNTPSGTESSNWL